MSLNFFQFQNNTSAQVPLERKFQRKQSVCYASAVEKKAIELARGILRLEMIIAREEYQPSDEGLG